MRVRRAVPPRFALPPSGRRGALLLRVLRAGLCLRSGSLWSGPLHKRRMRLRRRRSASRDAHDHPHPRTHVHRPGPCGSGPVSLTVAAWPPGAGDHVASAHRKHPPGDPVPRGRRVILNSAGCEGRVFSLESAWGWVVHQVPRPKAKAPSPGRVQTCSAAGNFCIPFSFRSVDAKSVVTRPFTGVAAKRS
jgi:hypothetical protein